MDAANTLILYLLLIFMNNEKQMKENTQCCKYACNPNYSVVALYPTVAHERKQYKLDGVFKCLVSIFNRYNN